jgi:SAM-dependent methyltransferase
VGLGRRYADDFWSFLECYGFAGKRLLELGCGNGYLLHRLSQAGARCTGLEPGVQAQQAASHYGLEVIGDFFPSHHLQGPFDFIVHDCVLEHLEDPSAFLKAQVELLSPEGRILLAVPNVEPHLRAGDLSIFVHEHWSYFTPDSLRQLLAAAGLQTHRQVLSSYGGLVYVEASRGSEAAKPVVLDIPEMLSGWRHYLERGKAVLGQGGHLGVFPAVRLVNLISMLQVDPCPRLFDDDSRLHGKYFPPLPMAIEGRGALLQNPVDCLVLSSRAFAELLQAQLSKEPALARTRIVTL